MNDKKIHLSCGILLIISSIATYFYSHSSYYKLGPAQDFWYLPGIFGCVYLLFFFDILHTNRFSKGSALAVIGSIILGVVGYIIMHVSNSLDIGLEFPLAYFGGPLLAILFFVAFILFVIGIFASLFAKKV